MDLIDIFRTFHPNAEEYTFFSSAHGTFSRTDYILGHKSNLSKFKKIEIISSIFSDHNAKRCYQLQEKSCKKQKHIKIKHTFLNNEQVKGEIKREIKTFIETYDDENTMIQNL